MKRQMDFQAESFIRERKRHTRLRRAIALLCAVVMLLTMNSLKMNADTLEHIPGCGLEEHRHTLACYPLVCPLAEAEPQYEIRRAFTGDVRPHVHSEDCYDDSGNLACGYVESLYYHVHNRWCYDDGGNLVCGLSEIQPHVHTEACYQDVPTLICGQDEYPAHHHTQDCYFTVRELACGQEENPGHIHTAECYYDHNELTCGLEESVGHIHTADCYIPVVETTCGMEEGPGHIHTAECFTRELVCGELESEAHQHTDACYADVLTCEIPEGYGAHTHSESCYTVYNILVCGVPEGEGAHTHTRDCVTSYHTLICGIPEGEGAHTHTDNCYINYDYLVCGQEETEGHTHTDACYEHTSELICGEQDGSEWVAMMLGQEGVQVHTHTAECFTTFTRTLENGEERTLRFATCGYQEIPTITCQESDWTSYPVLVSEGHAHTDACYDLTAEPICGMVEHEHTDACYQTRPVKAGATPAEGGNGDANSADLADLMEDTGSENGENETDGQSDDPSAETNADGDLDEVENATQVDNDENEAENQEQTEVGNEDSADLDALTDGTAEGGLSDVENGDVIDAETPAEGALIDEPADGEPSDIEAADADEAADTDTAEGELTDGTADGEPSDIEAADGEPSDEESGEPADGEPTDEPTDEESDETVDGEPTDEESDEPTEGETTDEESGETNDEESGETTDKESGDPTDEETDETADGEPTDEESGETTDKESDETADGEPTDKESGESTDEETGEPTDKESDETADGETTDEETDKTADEESGETTDEESGETADGEPSDVEAADGEPTDEESDETADGEPTDEESGEPTEFTAGERVIEVKDGSVTLVWGPEAEIPEDVRVEVIEIERGTTDYDILYNNAMAALSEKKDTETTTQVMRFFDITLYNGEDTIEPKAAISVTVQVNEAEATDNDADVDAVHMEDVGAQATVVEATTDSDTVSFEAESFSIYGVVVDVPATEAEEPPVSVAVDLSSVDLMAAAEVTDTVSLSIPDLLAGADESAVQVEGELGVDPEALRDAKVSAPEGVQVDGDKLVLSADALESGVVSLEVTTYATEEYETIATTHKVDIELSDYQGRTDVAEGENITVEALEGNSLPADAVPVVSQKEGEVPEEIVAPEAPNEASAIFDITVKNGNGEGEEISNTGAVVVTVIPEDLNVLDALPEGADPKDVKFELFHVHDGVTTPIELDEGAVVMNEEGKVEQFTFETDGFSDFILKFTVEFHNGDKEICLTGGNQALLSTLIDGLGLVRANGTSFTVDEVASVEFATPDLFSVEEVTQSPVLVNDEEVSFFTEHDFLITSLLPFEEDRMILTMTDGEVIEVKVTDDQSGKVSITFTNDGNPTFSRRLFLVGGIYNNSGKHAYAEIISRRSTQEITSFKSSVDNSACYLSADYDTSYFYIYEYTGSQSGDINWEELNGNSNKLNFGSKYYVMVSGYKFTVPQQRGTNYTDRCLPFTAEKVDKYIVSVQFNNQNGEPVQPDIQNGNYYVYAAIRKYNSSGNKNSIYYNCQLLHFDANGHAYVEISEYTRNNGANPSSYPMSASDAVTLLLVKNENADFIATDSDNEGAINGGTVIEDGSVLDGYGFTRTDRVNDDGYVETIFTATKATPYTYSVQAYAKNGTTPETLDLNDQHWYVYAEVNHPDGKYIYVKQLVGNETNVEIDKLYKRDAATGDNAVQNARNAPTTIPATGEVVTFALLRAKMESTEGGQTNNPENLVYWRNKDVLWGYFATTDHMNVMALNGASVANRYTLRVEPGTQHSTLKLVQGGDAEITVESYNGTTKETAPSLDTTGSYFIVGKMYFSDGTEHKSRYYVEKLESGNLSATIDAGFADGNGRDVQYLTGTRSYEPMLVFVPNNTTITADQVRQKLAANNTTGIDIYRSGDVLLSYRLTAESGNLQAPNTTIRLDKLPSLKSKGQVEDANVSDTANLYILAEIDRGGVKSYAWRAFSTNPLPEGSFGDFETEGGATVYYREEDKVNFYIVKSGSAIDSVSQALAASRFAAGQLVQVGGVTYKVGFTFDKATSTVNATLTEYTPPEGSAYTVRVELLNAAQNGPKKPESPITDDYKVLAVLTSKDEATLGQPVAWALLDVDEGDLNGSDAAFEGSIDTSAFNVCDANMNATGQTIGYNAGAYDIDLHLYHMASWPSEPTYAQIVAAESTAPEGYDLKGVFTADKPDPDISEEIDSDQAIIRLHTAYARSYGVRAKINTAGLSISQGEEYYVRVRLNHSNGGTYYAFAKLVVNDGQTVANLDFVTYKINNVDTIWYSSNGTNLQSAVTYTGDEGTTELEIISVKHGQSFSTAECAKPVGSNVPYTIVKFGESINMYTATRGERELAENLGTQTVVVCDVVDFTRDTEGVSKGAIDGYLETATDFGLYTITLSLHATDMESNIGAQHLTGAIGADYGFSGNNLQVNRVKVVKKYVKSNGDPVSGKTVTLRLYPVLQEVPLRLGAPKTDVNGHVDATYTTGADGTVQIIFDRLPAGKYLLKEVIDGVEYEYASGSNGVVVLGDGRTVKFSERFIEIENININYNYFGDIDNGVALNPILERSRHGVIVVNDSEDYRQLSGANSQGQATVVKAGTDPKYPVLDIASDINIRLNELSRKLATSTNSKTVRYMTVTPEELNSTSYLDLKDDGRYIVVNVDMSRAGGAATVRLKAALNGHTLQADFGQGGGEDSSKVLFNFITYDAHGNPQPYTGKISTVDIGSGVLLAPSAIVADLGGNFGGTIVCREAQHTGSEIHSDSQNKIQNKNTVLTNSDGRINTGDLNIIKSVEGTSDRTTWFTFRVTLTDGNEQPLTGTKSYAVSGQPGTITSIAFVNGVALVKVRAGERALISGIPAGYHFSVEEVETDESEHYTVKEVQVNGFIKPNEVADGVIVKDNTANAEFTNKKKTGGLKVTKIVESPIPADKTQNYDFTITIKLAVDQTEAAGKDTLTYGSMTFTRQQDGTFTYTFPLKHEQSIEFSELPHDTQYTITEQTYDGFITTHNGNTGTISDDNPTVVFTNKRQVGALKIVKNVTVNRQTDTPLKSLADGDYTFKVCAFDDAATGKLGAEVTGSPVTITITNGVSNSASIGSLPAGKYVIVEQPAANGATLADRSGDGTDTTTDVGDNAVIVTVVADTTALTTAAIGTFTNDLTTTTDVSVEKTFTVVPTEAWSASFQLQSQRRLYSVNGVRATSEQIAAEADVDGEGWTAAAAVSPEVDIALNNAKTSDTVIGLAKYEGVTNGGTTKVYELRYTVVETALTIGGEDKLDEYIPTVTPTSDSSYAISVVNTPDNTKTSLRVEKAWSDSSSNHNSDVVTMSLVRYKAGAPKYALTINHSANGALSALPEGFSADYTVKDSNGEIVEPVNGAYSVIPGTYRVYCTVNDAKAPEGYSCVTTESPVEVVIVDQAGTAYFYTTYTEPAKTYGTLVINHAVSGLDSLPAGFAYAVSGKTTVDSPARGVEYTVETGTYTVSVDGTSAETPAGFSCATSPSSVEVNVIEGATAAAEFTSTYTDERDYGYITIAHVASGLDGTALPGGFAATYTITGKTSGLSGYTNVSAGRYKVLAGEYTVSANVTSSAAPSGKAYKKTDAVTVKITSNNEEKTATLTSEYQEGATQTGEKVHVTIQYGNNGVGNTLVNNGAVNKGSIITVKVTSHDGLVAGKVWDLYAPNTGFNSETVTVISPTSTRVVRTDHYWGTPHDLTEYTFVVVADKDIGIGISVADNSGDSSAVTGAYTVTSSSASISNSADVAPFQRAFNPFVAYADEDTGAASSFVSALPENYGADEDFSKTITLNSEKGWSELVTNLDVLDEYGQPYYYGIVETAVNGQSPATAGYSVSYSDNNPINAQTLAASQTIVTLTATNTPTSKTIYAKKVWKQGETPLTGWPAGISSVTFQLQEQTSSGWSNVGNEVTVNKLDLVSWDVDANKTYQVIETKVDGATLGTPLNATGTGTQTDPFAVTNEVDTVNIPVQKSWPGNTPPADTTVEVELYKDGVATRMTKTLNSGNSWRDTFTGLDKYNTNGTAITYKVVETKVTYYGQVYTGDNLTAAFGSADKESESITSTAITGSTIASLSNALETKTISAKKTWNGADEWLKDMSVTFMLKQYKEGDVEQAFTATAALNGNDTSVTIDSQRTVIWNNLPKYYLDGSEVKAYTYKVYETAVEYNNNALSTDYRTVYNVTGEGAGTNGLVVINNQTKTTERHAQKVWEDSNNAAKLRPDDITFTLTAKDSDNGTVDLSAYNVTAKKQANAGNSWKADWMNLPAYTFAGKEITYDVTESGDLDNYTLTGQTYANDTYTWTFTNTVGETETTLYGRKTMKGGETPGTYSFTLSANDSAPMPAGATTANGVSTVTVQNSGEAINFGKIQYKLSDMGNETEKIFTYTAAETTGDAADIVYDTTEYTIQVKVVNTGGVLSIPEGWPKYLKGEDDQDIAAFENEEVVDVDVTKTWAEMDNIPADTEVTVKLSATKGDGTAYALPNTVKTEIKLNGDTSKADDTTTAWYYKWQNLPKYDGTGKLITYAATETALVVNGVSVNNVADYKVNADKSDTAYRFYLKNRIPPIEIKAKKNWKQVKLPENVTIKLKIKATVPGSDADIFSSLSGVNDAQEQTLTGGTDATVVANWVATWSNLPQFYQRQKITYTVTETEYKIGGIDYTVADATPTAGYDFSFTNDLPEIGLSGKKTWVDGKAANTANGESVFSVARRPKSLTIKLYTVKGDAETEVTLQTANSEQNYYLAWDTENNTNIWTYTITHLPKYDADGSQIVYRVKEKVPDGYRADNDGVADGTRDTEGNITNADLVNTELTQLVVEKLWELNDLPIDPPTDIDEIKFHLYRVNSAAQELANDKQPATGMLSNDQLWSITRQGKWKLTISGLDKYYVDADTHEVKTFKYYVTEDEPEGWHVKAYSSDTALVIDNGTQKVTGTQTSDSNNGSAIKVNEGTVTITNAKYAASLPATGGMGTTTIYIAGASLLILAVLGFIWLNRKRDDGTGI